MSNKLDNTERRKRQRFLAQRNGKPYFWVMIDGQRMPLIDLSLEGFSIAATAPPESDKTFTFELRLEDVPGKVRGQAQTVNFISGEPAGQIGCRFISLESDSAITLHEWLTVHVICAATVRISAKEAESIVSGPSLI
ncbi:MAG TPA: PilZ domain-containing protein [Rhodocyclaceae bacterium]|nr:PilZ domain-containing protein [Rhodocyclaceae bacterium]